MFDFLDKTGLKAVLEQIKAKFPSSLPANGGNADYAANAGDAQLFNGEPSGNFRHITKDVLYSLPSEPTGEGDYSVINSTGEFPYNWGYMSIRYGSSTTEFVATFQSTGLDNKMYINTHRGGWVGWKEISTTPIKSTTFSATAGGTGNFNLWAPSENKVPISIQLDNKTFYAVPFLYNNQLWLGNTINEVTRQPVANVDVSGTVYYIEV